MIYFDNAATTKYKPKEVTDAYMYYITEIGVSPGRGSYKLGVEASRMLYKSRVAISQYFGLVEPNVVFTKNSTEAINMFLCGFLEKGDHVIISSYEHNAVLRPLEKMREKGLITYSVIDRADLNLQPTELIAKYVKPNTKLLATTLASNLTGRIIYNKELFKLAKDKGISTFLDASQGAGKLRINMPDGAIDFLAFTGHKDLNGLPGVGGLCSIDQLQFSPLIQGGTGVLGHEKTNPKVYPESYESGTLNMPAIWALKVAIELIANKEHLDRFNPVAQYLLDQLKMLDKVIVYDGDVARVDTIGFNVVGYSSNDIVKVLDNNNICVRGGIHCAILAHEALGTTGVGAVRVSLCENNTYDEVDKLIETIKSVGK